MNLMLSRGASIQWRLFLAVIIAIILMIADSQINAFIKIRQYMDTAISPLYFLVDEPRKILDSLSETLTTRKTLQFENRILREELLLKNKNLLLFDYLKQENTNLRKLLRSPLYQDEYATVTQVISTISNPYSEQVVIDKGSNNGVYEGQPVVSDKGVVGQIVAVAKITSRVLLMCDASHALPIQVLRNDIRAITTGRGCADDLQLEDLPKNTDIQAGDILVTSGLDGRFPIGYPVAVVSSVKINNERASTIIQAHPIARLKHLHYLLLLWGIHNNNSLPLPPDKVKQIVNKRLHPRKGEPLNKTVNTSLPLLYEKFTNE
ncbi:rod shape-determining protein MreC [Candidatus Gillettellia adelgis]